MPSRFARVYVRLLQLPHCSQHGLASLPPTIYMIKLWVSWLVHNLIHSTPPSNRHATQCISQWWSRQVVYHPPVTAPDVLLLSLSKSLVLRTIEHHWPMQASIIAPLFLRKLKVIGAISDELYRQLYVRSSSPVILYGLAKVHKANIPLRPILVAFRTTVYKLGKFLVPLIEMFSKSNFSYKFPITFTIELPVMQLRRIFN